LLTSSSLFILQVYAHLALLFFHIPPEELTRPIVSSLLAAQIFLTTRYRYDLAAENGNLYSICRLLLF